MRKFFPYMMAGILVSSLSVFACTTTTTSSDDDDDDATSSGSTSKDGGTSSSGGKTSSSSSSSGGKSSSSGGGGSSSGSAAPVFDVTSLTVSPTTATVGTEATHTFELSYTGSPADADGKVLIIYGLAGAPDGLDENATPVSDLTTEDPTEEGKVTGSFKVNAPLAGTYKVAIGFDGDQDQTTTEDQKVATADIVAQ